MLQQVISIILSIGYYRLILTLCHDNQEVTLSEALKVILAMLLGIETTHILLYITYM